MAADALFLGGTSIDLIRDKKKRKGKTGFAASVGGSVTNSSVISAKLGVKTGILSKIGADPFGNFAVYFLHKTGIDTRGIIQDPDIDTPLAIAKINKSGIAKYAFHKNSPEESVVPFKTAPKTLLNSCKVFHTGSSYSYQKETFEETLKFIKYLRKRKVFISYDPNIRPGNITNKRVVKNRVLTLLKLADLAKLSETDLKYLTAVKNPEKGLIQLKKLTKCELILTLGSKGSIYIDYPNRVGRLWRPTRFIKIPAFKVKIADTIGAGDAFTAGLISRLIKQGKAEFFTNMKANMIFASAVSALICTKKGANLGLKNIKQVNLFLAKNIDS